MKRILTLALVIIMMCALAVPAMASAKLPAASEGFAFHCNDIEGNGNGKTYIEGKDKDYGKFDKKTGAGLIQLAPAPGDTTGKIWVPVGKLGKCTTCGRSDWVSFSNKSGTPDGKNIQLQHPGPSKRYITITVIYNLEVPACEFACVNADAKCEFECTCDPCPWNAKYPGHTPCDNNCGVGHACPFDDDADLTCVTVCDCEKSESERIVNQKVLINIADGYVFTHTAPLKWKSGENKLLPALREIGEKLTNSKTYNFDYVGVGNCVCECDPLVCDAACEIHKEPSINCEHKWICNNCKDAFCHGGFCTNHPEYSGNKTMKCIECGAKWNPKQHNSEIKDCECPRVDEKHNPITRP